MDKSKKQCEPGFYQAGDLVEYLHPKGREKRGPGNVVEYTESGYVRVHWAKKGVETVSPDKIKRLRRIKVEKVTLND